MQSSRPYAVVRHVLADSAAADLSDRLAAETWPVSRAADYEDGLRASSGGACSHRGAAPALRDCAQMDFLYRLLPPRPTFAEDMSPAEAEVMQRHVGYWEDLLDRGAALAFGPVLDPENPWGLGILTVADEPAARALGDNDPAVDSGVCSYEVVPMQLVRRD